jgi:hypothetical protein
MIAQPLFDLPPNFVIQAQVEIAADHKCHCD